MTTVKLLKGAIAIATLYAVSSGSVSAIPLPPIEANQVIYNFDATSIFSTFGSFVSLTLNIQGGAQNSQIAYNIFAELNGIGLERQGLLSNSGAITLTNVQAPVDGKFSLGLYAPVSSVNVSSTIARLSATNGQVVFLDGTVSAVPELDSSLYLAIGVLALVAARMPRSLPIAHADA